MVMPFFPLQIHRVHEALLVGLMLVGAKGPGLLEQAIDERCLSVVNVCDNGDIANVLHKISNRAA